MEPPPPHRVPQVLSSAEEVAELYRELSRHPGLSTACLGPDVTTQYGGKYCSLYTEWSQRDLARAENVNFCRQYLIFHDGASVVYSGPAGTCSEIKDELLSRESPSGALKAVLRKVPGKDKEKEKQFLEVWDQNRKAKSIDLTALDKHGSVYDDDQFGCLAWSHSETHLLYVAEKKRPKAESFFQSKAPELGASDEDVGHPKKEDAPLKGEQFVYHEDWGEALSTRSVPVLCALDIEGSSVSVLEGVPEHLSPGQAFWSPGDTGVVFVGWWHEPFRLGLRHCTNRRSALFYVDLTGGRCELLSEDAGAVWSPRLSPDRCRIVYLENDALGPHQQCSRLRMYDWYTKHTSTVLEAVPRQAWGTFPGIYCGALPGLCWAADSRRLVLDTAQRSQQDVFVVNTATGDTTSLTADAPQGSWSVLTIDRDILVARFSTPSCPPTLKVAVLPGAGQEARARWVCLQDAPPVPGISWGIRTLRPPPEQEHPQYAGLDFDAILLRPSEGPTAQKPPLVVMPHGGPHSVFTAGWMLYPAALCRMGFAVLLVNYRGSLGFGQDSVASLPGNVGTQDVRDVQLCVERVLQEEPLDAGRVALVGGSHGGFLACHLVGQFPDTYRACVVRNPVVNIASMVAATDIPDWCLTETGLPYAPDALPDPAQWTEMLHKSPMRYVDRVRAPVLLMLGEDDRRVPPKQGLEYYRALKARGVPTRLLWYPGNNHALAGVEAEADGFMNMALWLIKHLGWGLVAAGHLSQAGRCMRCRDAAWERCPGTAGSALAACPLGSCGRRRPSAAEQGPMASGTGPGMECAFPHTQVAGSPAACYRELSRFPTITRAALGATAEGQTFLLYTECSRPDLPRRRLLRFSRHYSLRRTGGRGLAVSRAALSAQIHNQLLSQDSPTGQRRATLSRCPQQGHELLEVWDSGGRSHSVDLTALGKHGEVYTEGPFACLAWSHSETRLLYVAEKSRPKPRPPCPWDVPGAAGMLEEDEDEEGERFVYHEDWGEALSTRSVPVLCALDLEGSSISVLEGVPGHLSPGQALWSPGDRGVVFVGWWHEPFRLGLTACSNRRSGIFHLDLASGRCELLSAEHSAACSPRLSPDGQRLLYLEGALGGPHRQCLRLHMVQGPRSARQGRATVLGHRILSPCPAGVGGGFVPQSPCLSFPIGGSPQLTWQTRQSVTVLDVVQEPTEAFAGLYADTLPLRCWAADSRRAVLGTPQRSHTVSPGDGAGGVRDVAPPCPAAPWLPALCPHLAGPAACGHRGSHRHQPDSGYVAPGCPRPREHLRAPACSLSPGLPEGCWELLTLQWDLLVATCSAPHRPPSLVVAELPPVGRELPLDWVPVEDAPIVPGVTWKTLTVQLPCSGQSPTARGARAFEALLLSPTDSRAPHPLVVCPHGGPHAVFDARWRPGMAALCRLGFAVLLVNYRGSLGFGQASISSLLSRVGEQDVADTQLAVEQALRSEPLDPHRLALLAGSHGAFIALHLLAREPERYQACALRSPVSNLPALLGTSDIPDWRYTSLGLPYSFERVPHTEDVATMLLRSPIVHAARVRTPVLLCVGARDRRVSPTQALELYRVLRARGVPVRLLWYPAGGHALTGAEMEADVFRNCARWLLRHLGHPRQDGLGLHSP
ncbi:LOW QUALITY PROTEIN: acylamino-acid-releasing enzyme [Rhynochetos jubatus]